MNANEHKRKQRLAGLRGCFVVIPAGEPPMTGKHL
jgi:hypothetical protein